MKKVITMVGTSLFENYFENESGNRDIKNFYETLKSKRSKDWDDEKRRIEIIRDSIKRWIKKQENNQHNKVNISAEIKSLIKLKEELEDELEIFLLCSDTILSRLSGEIIKEVIPSIEILEIENQDDVKVEVIKGLQVENKKEFKDGLENLVNEIEKISGGFWDNVVINITGGYKATIPYLTILAQIFRCPLYYIFEETDELICIEPAPISIDWGLFEKYSTILAEFNNGIYNLSEFRKRYPQFDQFYSELKSLVWIDEKENLAELNTLGKIFWRSYIQYIPVYITRESEYFRLSIPDKKRIHNAIRELYGRLEKVLSGISEKEEAIKRIIDLTDQNDLRHGPVIDGKEGVFIFKSTNEEHIRLLYSFNLTEGKITSLTIYDFKYQKFEHDKYIKEFQDKYPDLKGMDKTIIPVKKEG